MAILTFLEYLNAQGKTIETAGDILNQKLPTPPVAPEKAVVKGKNYSFPAASTEKPNPYMSKEIKIGQGKDDETGLAFLKSPGMDKPFSGKSPNAVSELK